MMLANVCCRPSRVSNKARRELFGETPPALSVAHANYISTLRAAGRLHALVAVPTIVANYVLATFIATNTRFFTRVDAVVCRDHFLSYNAKKKANVVKTTSAAKITMKRILILSPLLKIIPACLFVRRAGATLHFSARVGVILRRHTQADPGKTTGHHNAAAASFVRKDVHPIFRSRADYMKAPVKCSEDSTSVDFQPPTLSDNYF
jgi:hypothetical protein